ncbi:MAG: hypothetical protein Kow0068_23900 [Marinilabiliales bacterium]
MVNNLIEKSNVSLFTDSINYQLIQKTGIVYGMEIRIGIYERFSIHTGINQIRRNFKVKISEQDSVYSDSVLKFSSYEIPVFVSGYVKLTKNLYLNGNLGLYTEFYPTNISIPHIYGKRYHWAQFSLAGGPGLELRTRNSGYFYLGASFKTHFHDMLYVLFYKDLKMIGESDENIPLSGNYFAIHFKYYFN